MKQRLSAILAVSIACACSSEGGTSTAPGASASAHAPVAAVPSAAGSAAPPAGSASPDGKAKPEGVVAVEFQETDFVEGERSRDPFREFVKVFAEEARSKIKSQREVVLDQYSLDELKLVGLVTRIQPERALLVDPTGKGHIVTRGQFIGRADIVQGGTSGADYELNWRIERIRDTDMVLVRDDPSNPDVPSATRIIPLRSEPTEEQQAALQ